MSETEFNSANYITLRQFQGGWIWLKNINQATTRIIPYLQGLPIYKIRDITDLLNGEVLSWQIFDDTQWVIRFIPLPNFIILIVFNHDEEFGSALKIFYHKSSLFVPTEDAYVFTEIFLDLVGRLAKYGTSKAASTEFQDQLISLPDLLEKVDPTNKEKMENDIVGQREAPLLKIDKRTAEQIHTKLGANYFTGTWQNFELEWGLKFKVFKNFDLYTLLPISKTNIQVLYTKNVLKYESRRVLFFTWLYCNATIREARLILGDLLPKLSDYL